MGETSFRSAMAGALRAADIGSTVRLAYEWMNDPV